MSFSISKPLLGIATVACIAAPAGTTHAAAAAPDTAPRPSAAVDREAFDPTPPALRATLTTGVGATATTVVNTLAAVDCVLRIEAREQTPADVTPAPDDAPTRVASAGTPQMAAAARHVDPILLLEFLTFPYHNFYAIGTAVTTALNSVVMTALLPVTLSYYVLDNQIDLIEPYIQTTLHNLRNAIPNILTTIRNEIAYDVNLFNQIFSAAPDPETQEQLHTAQPATDSAIHTADRSEDITDVDSAEETDSPRVTTKYDAAQDIRDTDEDETVADPVDETEPVDVDEPEADDENDEAPTADAPEPDATVDTDDSQDTVES